MFSALDRILSTTSSSASIYDTEENAHESTLLQRLSRFDSFQDKDIFNDGTCIITDKTVYYANTYYEKLKEYLKIKESSAKEFSCNTPFLDRNREPLKLLIPTFSCIDSFSEFETEDAAKIQNDNELGDSKGNTIHMKQGLDKTRFFMDIPPRLVRANHFLFITAQLGSDIQIAQGPYAAPPPKKLQYMKQGDKIKGVTDKFFFLTSACWHAINSYPLINQTNKQVEYPRSSVDDVTGDTDLNIVSLTQLRCKSGPSGYTLDVIVSQSQGVLPSLSEFHYLKTHDRFGLDGNNVNYHLVLYPDVNLSRTTIRGKIDSDPKLRRALNITSELCQLHQFFRFLYDELCTPQELYTRIKDQGYDWDFILEHTRGWWTINDDSHPLKFLSTLDLIKMGVGRYHPYWLDKDKKTIINIQKPKRSTK
jgi:hypothetical protein